MSCKKCLVHSGKFNTSEDFKLVKQKITLLVQQGEMECLGEASLASPYIEIIYKCLLCGQKWMLSHPDQAYRGSFKEVE